MSPLGYNETLLDGKGLRQHLHRARFRWVEDWIRKLTKGQVDIFELGCFDARLLRSLGPRIGRYCGFDAGWRGGLSAAQREYRGWDNVTLKQSDRPEDLNQLATGSFDLSVALETLEHIPPDKLDSYLAELARITRGHLLVSVPNEKGPILLGKYLAKRAFGWVDDSYSARELFLAAIGRPDLIPRREHKGFDYARLVEEMNRHFDVIAVENISLPGWPLFLSFSVGIVSRPRADAPTADQGRA